MQILGLGRGEAHQRWDSFMIDTRIQKVLVFSFSFIGDAVLSTAVIHPLRRCFPGVQIAFLVGIRATNLFTSDPQINQVFVYDNRGKHTGLRGKIRLIQMLRREKFDLVIDLRDSVWSRFVGGKRWGMKLRGADVHAVTRYLDVLQRHGVNTTGAQPKLEFTDLELAKRNEFLEENGVDRSRLLVGVHPGGNWIYKLWTPRNYARISDALNEKWNAQILLFASPDEQPLLTHVASLTSCQPTLVKTHDLRQVAALIEACNLYIGNDTGPMHIAAAVGIHVVAIFGSTNHHRSGPSGEKHTVVQSGLNLGCNPCHPGKHPGGCGKGSCAVIEAVTVEQVLCAIEKLVDRLRQTTKR